MHKINYLAKNWLIIRRNNQDLERNLDKIKGVVYDLGCGIRPYEQEIIQNASKYIGVDWSESLHGLHADIVANLNERLPVDDNAADTVVSFQVLEHLREPQLMLKEAYRILRAGGFIYLSVPFQWWVHEAPHDYFRYTRYGLQYLLERSGFSNIEIREASGFWVMWLLKLNYQLAKRVQGNGFIPTVLRASFIPFWFINQLLAPFLDRLWPDTTETAGYYVCARKNVDGKSV